MHKQDRLIMKLQTKILFFTLALMLPALVVSAESNGWKLPHQQGVPVDAPDAQKKIKLKNKIIDRIINQKASGLHSDRFIIDSIIYNFDAINADKMRLKKAGFSADVIQDIVAKGQWNRPRGSVATKTTIETRDQINSRLIKTSKDKFIKVDFRRWTEKNGYYRLTFINQTDHIINFHYLEFTNKTRNVGFTSDRRLDDESPGSNVLHVKRFNSKGRFGQGLVDFYDRQLLPHKSITDKSRHDMWKQDNRFTGNSTAFTSQLGGKNNKAASILRSGPFEFTHNVDTDDWAKENPAPVTIDIFYCYSYRDKDGKLYDRCARFNAHSGQKNEESMSFELGLKSDVQIQGDEFALQALPFETKKRDLGKQGLGSGSYNTKINKVKYLKDKQGKQYIQLYFLDDNNKRSPREKFYLRMELYSDKKNLEGKYDLTNKSKHWFVAGILISTFHFSNKQVGRQKVTLMELSKGLVTIEKDNEKGIYGIIELKGKLNIKVHPRANINDQCVEGLEEKKQCNYEYTFSVDGKFGAEKR